MYHKLKSNLPNSCCEELAYLCSNSIFIGGDNIQQGSFLQATVKHLHSSKFIPLTNLFGKRLKKNYKLILKFVTCVNYLEASLVALVVKNSPANAGDISDVGSMPGLGRSPGKGIPLQHPCLGNLTDRGVWQATVRVATESDTAEHARTLTNYPGLPDGSAGKEPTCNAGHPVFVSEYFTALKLGALKQPHLFANDTGHWQRGRGSAGIVHLFPVVSAGLSHAAVVS